MKKLLYLTLLIIGLMSCTDSADVCVNQIKDCIDTKSYPEECISKALNQYCGTDFNTSRNEWWYEMKDWAKKSKKNKEKLITLSEKLKEEAKDKGYKKLRLVAEEAIDNDILSH